MKVLLIGETWMSYGTHLKGATAYTTGGYGEGYTELKKALEGAGHEVTVIPNHLAVTDTPWTAEEFDAFDVVMLSDIPADALLLHDDAFQHGKPVPNRLAELARWVREMGGGVVMVGGFMSFSGFEGRANYHFTPLAPVLPVSMFGFDDRVERPEGINPVTVAPDHAVMTGITGEWPMFLGYNKTMLRDDAVVAAEFEGDPFLATREVGSGRTVAFASDCSPHWGSPEFLAWESYGTLWSNIVRWAGRDL